MNVVMNVKSSYDGDQNQAVNMFISAAKLHISSWRSLEIDLLLDPVPRQSGNWKGFFTSILDSVQKMECYPLMLNFQNRNRNPTIPKQLYSFNYSHKRISPKTTIEVCKF